MNIDHRQDRIIGVLRQSSGTGSEGGHDEREHQGGWGRRTGTDWDRVTLRETAV